MEATTGRPLHEDPEVHARRWFILAVMCTSLVLVVMSVSGLNVAIPTIQRELGASATELQWIIDAYGLVGGLSHSRAMVFVGRSITGFGAAFVMPATLSIITTVFPPHERRRAIAM